MTQITSERWNLVKRDILKTLKGALIAGVGAILTFLQVYFIGIDPQSVATSLSLDPTIVVAGITAINSVLTNIIIKFASKTNYIIK